jgi:hypothetical protein
MSFVNGGYAYFLLGIVTALGVPLIIGGIILYLHRNKEDREDKEDP